MRLTYPALLTINTSQEKITTVTNRPTQMPSDPQRRPGIFSDLVDHAAYIDVSTLSIWREQRPNRPNNFHTDHILRSGSKYACVLRGRSPAGNPVDLKYGRIIRLPRIPPLMITVRSEAGPITEDEMSRVVELLVPGD